MQPDPGSLFHEEHDVYLGDFVRTTNGTNFTGRVFNAHFWCPEDDSWLRAQTMLGPDPMEYKNYRWLSVLVHDGGAIAIPDVFLEKVEPFKLNNPSSGLYFPLSEKVCTS